MMKLQVICKASTEIGLGHLMRSIAFSVQTKRAFPDYSVTLTLIGDGRLLPRSLNVLDSIQICSDEQSLELQEDLDVAVLDMLDLEEGTAMRIREASAVVSLLSPIFNRLEIVDLFFSRTKYTAPGLTGNQSIKSYVGLEYVIISDHCKKIETEVYQDILHREPFPIAISMGGGDAANNTLAVLNSLKACSIPAFFWVLLGEGYRYSYDALVETIKEDGRHEIILAKANMSMWQILRNCAMVVLQGGITTYEAAYSGLPSLNFILNPGQQFLLRELEEADVLLNLGSGADISRLEIVSSIEALYHDRERLLQMHLNAKSLIDGLGAIRIVNRIREFREAQLAF